MDKKSPDAFRTISEVADWLGVPTHVLRFWESRFSQVKPVKRAGGRRYYRPSDMELLGGIRKLLHEDGMTIRGVQKLLREQGVKYVAALSPMIDSLPEAPNGATNVVAFEAAREEVAVAPAPADPAQEAQVSEAGTDAPPAPTPTAAEETAAEDPAIDSPVTPPAALPEDGQASVMAAVSDPAAASTPLSEQITDPLEPIPHEEPTIAESLAVATAAPQSADDATVAPEGADETVEEVTEHAIEAAPLPEADPQPEIPPVGHAEGLSDTLFPTADLTSAAPVETAPSETAAKTTEISTEGAEPQAPAATPQPALDLFGVTQEAAPISEELPAEAEAAQIAAMPTPEEIVAEGEATAPAQAQQQDGSPEAPIETASAMPFDETAAMPQLDDTADPVADMPEAGADITAPPPLAAPELSTEVNEVTEDTMPAVTADPAPAPAVPFPAEPFADAAPQSQDGEADPSAMDLAEEAPGLTTTSMPDTGTEAAPEVEGVEEPDTAPVPALDAEVIAEVATEIDPEPAPAPIQPIDISHVAADPSTEDATDDAQTAPLATKLRDAGKHGTDVHLPVLQALADRLDALAVQMDRSNKG